MFTPTREEARLFLTDSWAKFRAHATLTDLEQIAAGLIALHPEYYLFLEHPDQHTSRDFTPETGDVNPFLHLSLHLAVAEQLAIDQPPGICAEFARIRAAWRRARGATRGSRMSGRSRPARAAVPDAAGWRAVSRLPQAANLADWVTRDLVFAGERRRLHGVVRGEIFDVLRGQRGGESCHDRVLTRA